MSVPKHTTAVQALSSRSGPGADAVPIASLLTGTGIGLGLIG